MNLKNDLVTEGCCRKGEISKFLFSNDSSLCQVDVKLTSIDTLKKNFPLSCVRTFLRRYHICVHLHKKWTPQLTKVTIAVMSVLVNQLIFLGATNRSVGKGLLTGSKMTYRWLCVSAQSHMVTLMKAVTLEHSAQLAGTRNGLSVSLLLSWSGSSCRWGSLSIL